MADLIQFPRRAASAASQVVSEPMRLLPVHSVDDYGRDPHLVSLLSPVARLRWDVGVSGVEHLPKKGGALLVCNSRRFALAAVYTAWALGEATGRPVRFVGRPDVAPIGPFMRRIGGLLARPDEVRGALRNHELVVLPCAGTADPRHAGPVSHELVGAAVVSGTPVFPVATMSNAIGRTARAEVGPQVRPRHKRRGPLADVEMAEQVQHHVQRMLDGFGGVQTGVAPIDWLAEG